MNQTCVVVGYFSSRAAARRSLHLLSPEPFRSHVYEFGEVEPDDALVNLALSWVRPGEWVLVVHQFESQAHQLLKLLQRSGEAVHAAVLSPELLPVDLAANHGTLLERWQRSFGIISATLNRQVEQAAGGDLMQQPAKWGVAEAAYEDSLAGISLIEHRYVLEGYIEQLSTLIAGRGLRKLPTAELGGSSVPFVYKLANKAEAKLRGDLSERRLLTWLRAECRELDLTRAEFKTLEPMLIEALMEDLAAQVAEEQQRESEVRLARLAALRVADIPASDLALYSDYLETILPDPSRPMALLILELLRQSPEQQEVLARLWGLTTGEQLSQRVRRLQQHDAERLERFNRVVASLRGLARTDWEIVLESVSPVTQLLRQDPSGHFVHMDTSTRNQYQERVADIASWSGLAERAVAQALLTAATDGVGVERHIGYHLIDAGRQPFERALRCHQPFGARVEQWAQRHATVWYLGLMSIITLLLLGAMFWSFGAAVLISWPVRILLLMAALLPVSQIAIELTVYITSRLVKPVMLPKLYFERGLPAAYRSAVVVPTLLRSEGSIRADLERLEIRYLANADKRLSFGLLTDLSDAVAEELTTDGQLVQWAQQGIGDLQQRYPEANFFLYHRPRIFAPGEGVWMGEERKRGKIEAFNAFLLAKGNDAWLLAGDIKRLQDSRFVITLDEDTELPPGTALRMIEALAHPLNEPQLDMASQRVVRGYGIIQPRVTTSLESGFGTRLSRLLNARLGVDPYLVTYSDLYFDLAGEGVFHGKGIYDPAVFDAVLGGRLPDNRILSHDLLEGSYVRVALATDIGLFDRFPASNHALLARQHRWTRGDWQIASWARRTIPAADNRWEHSPLSVLSRWKITDNLRRSLVPVFLLILLLIPNLVTGRAGIVGLIVAFVVIFIPTILRLLDVIIGLLHLYLPDWRGLGETLAENIYRLILLPRSAWLAVDALARVWYRLHVSGRKLLQWQTAADIGTLGRRGIDVPSLVISVVAVATLVLMIAHDGVTPIWFVLLVLWATAPLSMKWLDQPTTIQDVATKLTLPDRIMLRRVALQTWRFFDELMNKDNNFLPPDNYQVTLKLEVARRTSPTNIGLGILAWVAARDLGFISIDQLAERTGQTLKTLERLETSHGHIFNWYRTDTLEPLEPRYISMVDSGNLMASLWTYRQGMLEQRQQALILPETAVAWRELIDELKARVPRLPATIMSELSALAEEAVVDRYNPANLVLYLDNLVTVIGARASELQAAINESNRFLIERLIRQAQAWQTVSERYLSWYRLLAQPPVEVQRLMSATFASHYQSWLTTMPTLESLAAGETQLPTASEEAQPVLAWWWQVGQERESARERAVIACRHLDELAATADRLANRTDMRFLYHPVRKVFHIGYNLEEEKLDPSFYDLLASEARIGSFTAIAAGQVPAEHWWALGRNTRRCDDQPVLLSWSGTMFEYLLPRLLMREYPGTLLQQGMHTAVAVQQNYAQKLEIPWGISESAHSALDYDNTYQYRAFGAPPLGIQSGLEQGIVVAPYASMLALPVDPVAAVGNLRLLERQGLRGDMGFFDAVDYRRAATASGERGVGVYTYMAHHQGMGLVAIANVLGGDQFPERFHRDLRVRAARTLLHERAATVRKTRQDTTLQNVLPLRPLSPIPVVESTASLTDPLPQSHVLTNGRYTVMLTATGSGFSRWQGVEVNRWSADALRDEKGSYLYLRDPEHDALWSAAFQPTLKDDTSYTASFMPEKAVFRRTLYGIASEEEIYVVPDHDVEVRRLHLRNTTSADRTIEVTSMMEFGLAAHEVQTGHPAFNKLFIGVEALPEQDGVLAHRRLRSNTEQPVWAAHLLVNLTQPANRGWLQADRETFLGRSSSPEQPNGVMDLASGQVPQYPLDPIAAITQRVTLAAGGSSTLAALTITAATREEVIRLANRYRQTSSLSRARQVAWTLRQAELQRLQITEQEAGVFQSLIPYLLFPNSYLKSAARGLVAEGQAVEVGYADLPAGPCMVAALDDIGDLLLARQLGLAQKYFQARGLHFPLVFLVKLTGEAGERLTRHLSALVESLRWLGEQDSEIDIHIWSLSRLSDEVLAELVGRARVVLDGADGPLRRQMNTIAPLTRGIERPVLLPATAASISLPEHIEYANTYGGFTDNGCSYTIAVDSLRVTPAPWANVMANAYFGTLVTERGGGFTWSGNSQEYRLTPWRNEPLTDVPTELVYVHDLENDRVWSPQPSFHPSGAALVSHRAGKTMFEGNYDGLGYTLATFVPVGWRGPSSVKIQRLHLSNPTAHKRKLRLTIYAEWVLGTDREHWQDRIVTGWNDPDQLITAINPAQPDYGHNVAFLAQNRRIVDFTTDRAEFLGPLRSDELPHGLGAAELTGRIGLGLDPAGIMRSEVELLPGQELEIDWYMGVASNAEAAAVAVRKLREAGSVTEAMDATAGWWDQTLSAITVETPAREVDILMNRWLIYQVLSGRIWGRTGYYQSSGAFGFRDQLQDSLAMIYSRPEITRNIILEAARHQFKEGDAHHWWMPGTLKGLRSRITDDRLWLPFVVAQYVSVTGDKDFLNEVVPYMEAPALKIGQADDYAEAKVSQESGTILDHCLRAIAVSLTRGQHGLPLMGSGDWNDGYNLVGHEGKGESVWLGWFEIAVLHQTADLLETLGNHTKLVTSYRDRAKKYTQAIEASAWDGQWYVRAFYDDGSTLGSARNDEGKIDSLPQSWAVIAGTGSAERQEQAMDSAVRRLVDRPAGIVNLLTPPFSQTKHDPGYIKGYLPGARENGGQYTHGSLWLAMALARMGRGDEAVDMLRLINPVNHGASKADADRYVLEPYVMAGDVYSLPGHEGRGGWSWYTGSSGWMYRVWLEEVLGFRLRGQTLEIAPCIDHNWSGFKLTYHYRSTTYIIEVTNPHNISRGVAEQILDGTICPNGPIALVDDGGTHRLEVRMGF